MTPRYLSQSLCISYVTRLLLIITAQHHNVNTTLSCKNDLAYGVSQPYAKPAATARSSRYPYQCLIKLLSLRPNHGPYQGKGKTRKRKNGNGKTETEKRKKG